jgi:DNA-binding CsgD family transcriptional regulator
MKANEQFRVNLCVAVDDIRHLDALIHYLKAHGLNFEVTIQPTSLVAHPTYQSLKIPLSQAERRVLQSLVHHDTIQEAAEACFISRCTARAHLANVYQKLNVHSIHRAIVVAYKHGAITFDPAPDEEPKRVGR